MDSAAGKPVSIDIKPAGDGSLMATVLNVYGSQVPGVDAVRVHTHADVEKLREQYGIDPQRVRRSPEVGSVLDENSPEDTWPIL